MVAAEHATFFEQALCIRELDGGSTRRVAETCVWKCTTDEELVHVLSRRKSITFPSQTMTLAVQHEVATRVHQSYTTVFGAQIGSIV